MDSDLSAKPASCDTLLHWCEAVLPLAPNATCRDALHRFKREAGRTLLPIVRDGVPIGVLTRTRLIECLARDRELNTLLSAPITRIARRPALICDAGEAIDVAVSRLSEQGDVRFGEGVIVTQSDQYAGLVAMPVLTRAALEAPRRHERTEQKAPDTGGLAPPIGLIAHEIRTPLSAMMGVVSLLAETKRASEVKPLVETLDQSGRELNQLLDDLISLARMSRGAVRLQPTPCDLVELAEQFERAWRPSAQEKRLAFKVEIDGEMPEFVTIDHRRFRQMLDNLVGNAVKFTERGRVEVRLSLTRRLPSGHRLVASVTDTGCGIGADLADRLFTPFEQARTGPASLKPGSGLGLAIVRGLAEAMGGDVHHETPAAGGARFVITVPAERATVSPAEPEAAQPNAPIKPGSGFELGQLLVAEDHPVHCMVLERALTQAGWQIDLVHSGVQALRRALDRPYQAILLDVHMPEANGLDVVRQIRSDSAANGTTPILAVTADLTDARRAECLRAGFDTVIEKPVRASELMAALSDFILTPRRDVARPSLVDAGAEAERDLRRGAA